MKEVQAKLFDSQKVQAFRMLRAAERKRIIVSCIGEVLDSVRRNFLDGTLRSGCEFRNLILERSLKPSMKRNLSKILSNISGRITAGTVVDRLRQLLLGAFFFFFRVYSATAVRPLERSASLAPGECEGCCSLPTKANCPGQSCPGVGDPTP